MEKWIDPDNWVAAAVVLLVVSMIIYIIVVIPYLWGIEVPWVFAVVLLITISIEGILIIGIGVTLALKEILESPSWQEWKLERYLKREILKNKRK